MITVPVQAYRFIVTILVGFGIAFLYDIHQLRRITRWKELCKKVLLRPVLLDSFHCICLYCALQIELWGDKVLCLCGNDRWFCIVQIYLEEICGRRLGGHKVDPKENCVYARTLLEAYSPRNPHNDR